MRGAPKGPQQAPSQTGAPGHLAEARKQICLSLLQGGNRAAEEQGREGAAGGALREVSMDGSRVGNEAVEMLYVFSARHKLGFHLPLQVGWGA